MKPKSKLSKYHFLTEPEFGKTKRINTWINGDSHCFIVCINPKEFRSWLPILAHISDSIQPTFGMVKRLVALSTKRSVHSFDELDPKEKYIAMGGQSSVKIPIGGFGPIVENTASNTKSSPRKLFYVGELNPKSIPFLEGMKKKKLTVVYIAINGKTRPPQKVIFNENDMKDWNLIRNYLARILGIAEGVQHICTIYGDILTDANQFQHGYLYVVVPFTKSFIPMDYVSLSDEKSGYRKNFMPPIQPAYNMNSFLRSLDLEIKPTIDNIHIHNSYSYENEKLRPKKDPVTQERQKIFNRDRGDSNTKNRDE